MGLDHVHVVAAELAVRLLADPLVVPLDLLVREGVDAVTGRGPVHADRTVGVETAPPPGLAHRSGIVLDDPVVNDHRAVVVRVARDEVYVGEAFDGLQQGGRTARRAGHAGNVGERGVVVPMKLHMEADDQRSRLVLYGSQVVGQPLHLSQRNQRIEIAVSDNPLRTAGIDPVDVVQHHIVHTPEVERIVVRTQRIAIGRLSQDVARDIGIVVVVAHRVEDRNRITAGGQQPLVIGYCKVVVVPIAVPGHVARNQAVDRQRTRIGKRLRFGEESVAEEIQVILFVGQVKVGAHQHHVAVVVHLH